MEGPAIGSSNGLFLTPCKPVVALEVVGSLSDWLKVVALVVVVTVSVAVLDVLVTTGVTVVLVAIVDMLLAAKVYSILLHLLHCVFSYLFLLVV